MIHQILSVSMPITVLLLIASAWRFKRARTRALRAMAIDNFTPLVVSFAFQWVWYSDSPASYWVVIGVAIASVAVTIGLARYISHPERKVLPHGRITLG
jgi:multisubunit Na+/H+ antiporter MnhF subunit